MVHHCNKSCGNKTANGYYCATTDCINPLYSNIGTAQYGQGVQKRIVTNADRIRIMTDEELAELLASTDGDFPPNCEDVPVRKLEAYWLDWLRQEVKE